jgi:hypothetical protein
METVPVVWDSPLPWINLHRLPRRPRSPTRFHRTAEEIGTLEHGLVGHLGEINRTLERRIRVRKAKGEW